MEIRHISTAVCLALTWASCTPEIQEIPEICMPSELEVVVGDVSTVPHGWTRNDAAAVFGAQSIPERYVFEPGRDRFVRFTDTRQYEQYYDYCYMISPFGADITPQPEGVFSVELPDCQTFMSGKVAGSSDLMVGVSELRGAGRILVHSVLGYLRFRMAGSQTVESLDLVSNAGESLCGSAEVKSGYAKVPSICALHDGCDTLRLECGPSGVRLSSEVTDFVFCIPPGEYAGGFTVLVNTPGVVYRYVVDTKVSVSRAAVTDIGGLGIGTRLLGFAVKDADGRLYRCMDCSGPEITVCVPRGTGLASLEPVVEHDGQSVFVDGSALVSGAAVDMSRKRTITVSNESGVKDYSVNVIECDLPVVHVSTPDHVTIADRETWIAGSTFIIQSPDGSVIDYGESSVKGRGNASWKRDKKSYGIKLASRPDEQGVLGMPGHKRWCMIAVQWGYLGNSVGYELSRRTGSIAWQPSGRYVEFVLNGRHMGTYFLAEQIRVDRNRVDINNGYLLTYDRTFNDPNRFKSKYFDMPVMIKDPDEDELTEAQFKEIEDYINEMEAAMRDDARFARHEYMDYLDIDTYIDMWFVWELAGATGSHGGADFAHPNSVWFNKDGGGKLKAGPCWDFDSYLFSNQTLLCNKGQYYGRLFTDPAFVDRVKARWPGFRASVEGRGKFATPITGYIDSCYNVVSFSAERNRKMWTWTFFQPQEEYETIRAGLPAKMDWLEKHILNL